LKQPKYAKQKNQAPKNDHYTRRVVLSIQEIQEKHQHDLMRIPGVVGVGIGLESDESVLVVMVAKDTRAIKRKVPKELDGYRLVIQETGVIRAF
jgi:hypothetical protein